MVDSRRFNPNSFRYGPIYLVFYLRMSMRMQKMSLNIVIQSAICNYRQTACTNNSITYQCSSHHQFKVYLKLISNSSYRYRNIYTQSQSCITYRKYIQRNFGKFQVQSVIFRGYKNLTKTVHENIKVRESKREIHKIRRFHNRAPFFTMADTQEYSLFNWLRQLYESKKKKKKNSNGGYFHASRIHRKNCSRT